MALENLAAERNILSTVLKHPDKYFLISDIICQADFTATGNGLIWGVIEGLIKEGNSKVLDPALIIAEAEKQGIERFNEFTLNGDMVSALHRMNSNPENLDKYVVEVKSASIKRALINTFDEQKDWVSEFTGSPIDLRNHVEDKILGCLKGIDLSNDELVNLSDDFEDVINSYADKPGNISLDIGLPRWQKDCGGIRNGTITGVFARSKAGKSQLSMWAAFKTAIEQGKPVLYLDTELQAREQQMRLCGIMTGIPYEEIESGSWRSDKEKIAKIKAAFALIKSKPLYYKSIAGLSIQHIIPIIRKFATKYVARDEGNAEPRGLIIYDYIKIMSGDDLKNVQEYQQLGFITSGIHDLAVKLNLPVLALGQLNRDGFKVDSELAAAGADRIVHLVDSFTILRAKKPEEIELNGKARGNAILKVCVARYGAAHDDRDYINLHFNKAAGQFKEDMRSSELLEQLDDSNEVRNALVEEDILGIGDVIEGGADGKKKNRSP